MTIAPWAEWLPDLSDFRTAGSPLIKNCVPITASSYGPMPTAIPHSTNTLGERCQGSYTIKAADNTVYLFAGDHVKLYMLPPSATDFVDVTGATGPYNTPSPVSGGHWSMTSYGARVIATNGADPPQTILLPVGATPQFADLSADAPVARYVAVVKDFLMFGWTIDPVDGSQPQRVWWSSINSPASWPTPGSTPALQTQSDFQDLQQTDLGQITGLVSGFAPGSDVVIFCERGIWTASYTSLPLIFNFKVAQGAAGSTAPLSIVQSFAKDNTGAIRPVVYYLTEHGFAAFDGNTSFPIGAQKFDREFYNQVDDAHIANVQGIRDPRTRIVMWGFPTPGSEGMLTKLLVYNWELGRATISELERVDHYIEWLTTGAYGVVHDLDHIDSFGDLDTITPSFDDPFWSGNAAARVSFFLPDHRLNIAGGPPMAPTLDTGEIQPVEGRRAWVQNTRPLHDGGAATIAIGHRERQTDPVTWEPAVAINQIGECPQRCTGRYLRFRFQMPAGQNFTTLDGIDVQLRPEATRR
jgi:hypothetical protein